MLGIDEAGRGSLVGPLVVGAFLCPQGRLEILRELGARDSKLLPRAQRERVYRRLQGVGQCVSIALEPARIDRYVARGGLNRLEAEAFARLVRSTGPREVFVDACDTDPDRFGRLVHRLSRGTAPIRSTHRADVVVPVVGAASIVAKVRRDRAIDRLARSLGPGIGSGYPSDRRTVDFVRNYLEHGAPSPRWLRASWATTGRLKRELSVVPLERFGP